MISQVFVLSARGDVLINRDVRGDVTKDAPEVFYRFVRLSKDGPPPVFALDGLFYLYIQRSALYFVAATPRNVSPLAALEFLGQLAAAVKDFCGAVSEEVMRKHFALVYELIDEMVDFGYPQLTSTDQLRGYVVGEPPAAPGLALPRLPLFAANTIQVSAAASPIASARARNELFIDVVENVVAFFGPSGALATAYLDGQIALKSYLTGSPRVRIRLGGELRCEDACFHACVDDAEFAATRSFALAPPLGESRCLGYRVDRDFALPFRVHPFFTLESPFKVSLLLKLDADFPRDVVAKFVVVRLSAPAHSSSVYCEVVAAPKGQRITHHAANGGVEWRIEQLSGGSDCSLDTRITLAREVSAFQLRKEIGPVTLAFEVNQLSASPLRIAHITVDGTDKENPNKWVRYLTRSASYEVRL